MALEWSQSTLIFVQIFPYGSKASVLLLPGLPTAPLCLVAFPCSLDLLLSLVYQLTDCRDHKDKAFWSQVFGKVSCKIADIISRNFVIAFPM